MIPALTAAVALLVAHALLAGAQLDLGAEGRGAALVALLAGAGAGCLSRQRLPYLAEGLAITVLVPLRGPLCRTALALLPTGAGGTAVAAAVSLAPVGFALGRQVAWMGRGSLVGALVGWCLGDLAALSGAVAWLPGPFTGFLAAASFAVLAELGAGRRDREVPGPAQWGALPLGMALALAVMVLRRGVGAYHEPGLHADVTTRLALLLPAALVAWPASVLAGGVWSRRVFAALGAGLFAWALQSDVQLLATYADPGKHVGLSRAVNTAALRWNEWGVRQWWVWLAAFSGLAAAGLGMLCGALRWRALGPALVGADLGVVLHDATVAGSPFTLLELEDRHLAFVGPVTLLMVAAGLAWFGAGLGLAGKAGLLGLPLVLLPFVTVGTEYHLGLEEVRRIGEPVVEAFQRRVAGDVAVFSTYGPDTASPEGNERYRSTFTQRRPLWNVEHLEAWAADPEAFIPAAHDHGAHAEPDDHDTHDHPHEEGLEEAEPRADEDLYEYDEHGRIIDPTVRDLLKQRRHGLRVAGVDMHGDEPPTGPEGSATRLLRLFGVPGRAGVFGIGAEFLAADLVDAGLARSLVVGSEAPLGGIQFGLLKDALGLPGFEAVVETRPRDLLRRLAPGTLNMAVVAPGRHEWPGTATRESCEAYRDLRALLAPGGRALAWIDTTDLGGRALAARLAAFGAAFGERSAAFVEMRGLQPPFVLLLGWVDEAGRPRADDLRLPAPDLTGLRTRLAGFDDLSAMLLRDGRGLVELADDGPVHRAGRPQPTGLWADGGWAAVGRVCDPAADLSSVVAGADSRARPSPALLAGLETHGDYSYHLARLRTQVVEFLPDIEWSAFEREWRHYAEAAELRRDDPLLMLAVAALLEPLVLEQDFTRFAEVFEAVGADRMPSWRLALMEAVVRHSVLQPEQAAAARQRAREWGAPPAED